MKRVMALLLLLLLTTTGAHAQRLHGVEQFLIEDSPAAGRLLAPSASSPCDDSMFVALSARPAESLTSSERDALARLSAACAEARGHALATPPTAAPGLTPANEATPKPTSIVLPVIGVALAGILVYFAIRSAFKDSLLGLGFDRTTGGTDRSVAPSDAALSQ